MRLALRESLDKDLFGRIFLGLVHYQANLNSPQQNVISNSLEMAAGFPLSQLIFYVSGGLALCLLLAFIAILVGALAFKIKKKLSQRSYDTLH